MKPSTAPCLPPITRLKHELERADAILIGAGSGLSTAAGLSYSGARFERYFTDFKKYYHITDMYTGGFYPYDTLEEYWAWWSRQIYYNRYDLDPGIPYRNLLDLVKDKDYFVLTTNVDHQCQLTGFEKKRLFYTQGDYGLWQCSLPCHQQTYDNEARVRQMISRQKDRRIPSELIPYCPRCGRPLTMNLRCDLTFVQDEGWYAAYTRYHDFLRRHQGARLLLLELGVGSNTPDIIKYPFWQLTRENPHALYACINLTDTAVPEPIAAQSIEIKEDIADVLAKLVSKV